MNELNIRRFHSFNELYSKNSFIQFIHSAYTESNSWLGWIHTLLNELMLLNCVEDMIVTVHCQEKRKKSFSSVLSMNSHVTHPRQTPSDHHPPFLWSSPCAARGVLWKVGTRQRPRTMFLATLTESQFTSKKCLLPSRLGDRGNLRKTSSLVVVSA
jgi:hypothetical protein